MRNAACETVAPGGTVERSKRTKVHFSAAPAVLSTERNSPPPPEVKGLLKSMEVSSVACRVSAILAAGHSSIPARRASGRTWKRLVDIANISDFF